MVIDAKDYGGKCSCGRSHEMITQAAVIESDCLLKFREYIKKYLPDAKYLTAIYDDNTYKAVADRNIKTEDEIILPSENLHANEKAVGAVLSKLSDKTDVLVAIGSGTVHDITRYCANEKKIPFVSCPTAASVDGFCSSVAAMTWQGFKKTFPSVAPYLVLADVEVIKKSPIRLTRSGFGDMVGKYIALADWKIARALTGEFLCERIYDLMLSATNMVVESSEKLSQGDAGAYGNLTKGLILSGLAMQMMGNSRPASGAEHHVSHFIEVEPSGLNLSSSAYHGEKVGVATLLVLNKYRELVNEKSCIKDYKRTSREETFKIYGEKLTDIIMQENAKDCADGLTAEKISECFNEIKGIIDSLPDYKTLLDKYLSVGALNSLKDIGVDENLKETILKYSPLIRNRLTLMRVLNKGL